MAESNINVVIKMSGEGQSFDFKLDPTQTVDEALDQLIVKADLSKDNVSLVRKGRILKKDQKLNEVGVVDGETLHLVKKAAPKSDDDKQEEGTDSQQNQSMPGMGMPGMGMPGMGMPGMGMPGMGMPGMGMPGMGMPGMGMPGMGMPGMGMPGMGMPDMGMPGGFNPEMLTNMLNNPMIKGMINDLFSDPDKIKGILESNPILSQMAEGNPDIEELIRDPSKIKEQMTDDKLDEAIKGMQDNMKNMQGQTEDAKEVESDNKPTEASTTEGQPPFDPMQMFQNMMGPGGMGAPGMSPPPGLENMMGGVDPKMLNEMMAGFNLGGPQTQTTSSASNYEGRSKEDLKKEFKEQLETLKSMGFTNEDTNIEILKETNGDTDKAMTKILEIMS